MDNVAMSLRKKPSSKKSSRQERQNQASTTAVTTTPPGGGGGAGGGLPEGMKGRLCELFGQIEREFELLYAENTACGYQYLITESILYIIVQVYYYFKLYNNKE